MVTQHLRERALPRLLLRTFGKKGGEGLARFTSPPITCAKPTLEFLTFHILLGAPEHKGRC